MLDRPMKSAEEFLQNIKENIEYTTHPKDRWGGYLMTSADLFSLIKRVQQDSILHSSPQAAVKEARERVLDEVLVACEKVWDDAVRVVPKHGDYMRAIKALKDEKTCSPSQ